MRKLFLTASLLLMTSSLAQAADSFSFEINGQKVRIVRPNNCNSLSCLNIQAPGLLDSKSDDAELTPAPKSAPIPSNSATSAAAQPPAQADTGTASAGTVPPLPGTPASPAAGNGRVTTLAAPTTAKEEGPSQAASASSDPANQIVASAPVQPQATPQIAAPQAAAATGPAGYWMTEKNEGRVHVVNCGANLCGYTVNAKTGTDGEQVLINMKPADGGWRGRIHDIRGGGTDDSTIAMRGDNRMRVEGCAFGGMFCGGQTWTRVD